MHRNTRLLLLGVGLLSALLLLHHANEFFLVLREGVGAAALTLDFRTYMCGSANLAAPYDVCHNGEYVSGFVYPPPSLIYFNLLSRLPIDVAFLIHSVLCSAVLAIAASMAIRMIKVPVAAATVALLAALSIAPIGTSLAAGQVNILLMGAAVAGVWFAASSKPVFAGLAIAAGFWLKIYPGLVPALFLTRWKWRAALATIAVSAVLPFLALPWAAPELYVRYFLELLPHAQRYTMPGVAHTIAGVATHIAIGGGQPVQHFMPISHAVQVASKVLLAFGVIGAMAHHLATNETEPLDSLNLLLCVSLVAAPNAWGYHYALIFPAILAALARTLAAPSWTRTPLVLACWLALIVPAWTDPPHLLGQYPLFNVPFRARYGLVAVVLAWLIAWDARGAFATVRSQRAAQPSVSR